MLHHVWCFILPASPSILPANRTPECGRCSHILHTLPGRAYWFCASERATVLLSAHASVQYTPDSLDIRLLVACSLPAMVGNGGFKVDLDLRAPVPIRCVDNRCVGVYLCHPHWIAGHASLHRVDNIHISVRRYRPCIPSFVLMFAPDSRSCSLFSLLTPVFSQYTPPRLLESFTY